MAKRVVLKKGDIVSITRDNHKRYIQYVDNDYYQLNGDVICVFKKIYSSIDNPSVEEIIDDTYDLVLHTFLRAGIKYNGWEKIGHFEPKDVSSVHFFVWHDDGERDLLFRSCGIPIDSNWNVWTTVKEVTYEINLPEGICMPGFVYPPRDIEEMVFGILPLVHPKEKEEMIKHHIQLPPIATYKMQMQ